MSEFISEPILPDPGSFDTTGMGSGLPGLPGGFTWRRQSLSVAERLDSWKESSREGGTADGELYLRRHCFKLLMSDGSTWTVYFTRQASRGGNRKTRWFLYSIDRGASAAQGAVC
jgi:hypothetical protein